MGKKRVVTYDFNDDQPPNQVVNLDHHHNHHRHQNHQKPKKIKPEAKLLHTLNSHLKKIAKSHARNTLSLSPPSTISPESKSSLNHDHHHFNDRFTGSDMDHEDAHHDGSDDMDVFEFGQEFSWKTMAFIGSENYEDLFGGYSVFAPDLNTSHNMVVVFDEYGSEYGSYVPDPVMNLDNGDEGNSLVCDILHLSSLEEMINEFLKVNLFVS